MVSMRKNFVTIGIILIIIGVVIFASSMYIATSSLHYNEINLAPGQQYSLHVTNTGIFMYKSNISYPVKLLQDNVTLTSSSYKSGYYSYVVEPSNAHAIINIYNNYTVPLEIVYANIPISSSVVISGLLVIIAIVLVIAGIVIAIYGAIKK
uniref:Uncharacterized protein n=2 Tax=Acidianus brierleyi TaxID=41673 RepID=A0A2U9IGI5_9CREN